MVVVASPDNKDKFHSKADSKDENLCFGRAWSDLRSKSYSKPID